MHLKIVLNRVASAPAQQRDFVRRDPELDGAFLGHLLGREHDRRDVWLGHAQRPAEAAGLVVGVRALAVVRLVVEADDGACVAVEVGEEQGVRILGLLVAEDGVGVVGGIERRGDVRVVQQHVGQLAGDPHPQRDQADVAGNLDGAGDLLPLAARLALSLPKDLALGELEHLLAFGRLAHHADLDVGAALGPDAERVRRIGHDLQVAQVKRRARRAFFALDRHGVLAAVRVGRAADRDLFALAPVPSHRQERRVAAHLGPELVEIADPLLAVLRPELERPVGQQVHRFAVGP